MLTTRHAVRAPAHGLKTATPAYPMVSATAVMIHQLALDLYECVGAAWALVATRTVQKLAPLCVFGESPDLDASLHCSASLLFSNGLVCNGLSCDRDGMIELQSGSDIWTPRIVCPTFIRNETAGALIFGPKMFGNGYTFEEKALVLQFARHISKLLHQDPRAGSR
jgi:hypothetical protein